MRRLFSIGDDGNFVAKDVDNINAYLVSGPNVIVEKRSRPISGLALMEYGNKPVDGGNLLLRPPDLDGLGLTASQRQQFVHRIYGSEEFIQGKLRYCLWIPDDASTEAQSIPSIRNRINAVRQLRLSSRDASAREMAARAHQFREMNHAKTHTIVVPIHTSETRSYLPVGLIPSGEFVTNANLALFDASVWNMALIASRLHLVWIATVCGKLETRYRYSNTLGWNTFPVPTLTEKNKADLTRCAEDILLAREHHFPATIADLYDPDAMPADLRAAHERNDEVLERIYIGRRFKNDTERLEKLFDLYTKMTAAAAPAKGSKRKADAKPTESTLGL